MIKKLLKRVWPRQGEEVPPSTIYSDIASEEDIKACFRLILGRTPSSKEWHGHKNDASRNLTEIVTKFLSSPEFKNRNLSVNQHSRLEGGQHDIVELDGFKLCLSRTDNVCGTLLETKEYEPHVTATLKKVLAPGMAFLDIGANVGFFSCLAASIVGENGQVLSFEPDAYNIKLLNINTRLNGFENVEIFPFAVSDRKAFFSYDDSAGNSGAIFDMEKKIPDLLSSTLVYSVVLDEILESCPRKIDVIKIDIEGAEYMAFKGMKNRLAADRPVIVSEFSPPFLQNVSKKNADQYLRLLLIDKSYSLAVIADGENFINCDRNIDMVIQQYEGAPGDHIDIIAYPKDNTDVVERMRF